MAEAGTRTAERVLALLAVVCERGRANLSEAARATELAPSTALRLLRTLEGAGFVRRDEDASFTPGGRIIQLGAQALSNESLVDLTRPAMKVLAEATGESVYLSTVGHHESALYIAIVEGSHSVRHRSWVGGTIPLDGTAAGQALTGAVPPGSWALARSGVESDVTAIAAPIRVGRRVVAALSLVAPSYRIGEDDESRYGRLLATEVAAISAELGGPAEKTPAAGAPAAGPTATDTPAPTTDAQTANHPEGATA
ncbi:IclR family transcriptional regulator [Promicromonospora sp. AC04]|uniref:IclR family transcriptional regulator n=1 Tax=Promicromonospora sp. AC04 TaxID=2135723 RepID=UPI000D3C1E56|nr:IclR family transcriptional regulator [Promicromonospora sp. AC04]PUB29755.1 IclR family transcriptional regulator [Promicromonospora sp. AC04]